MGKFGRQPINDAGKGAPRQTYYFAGEERIERRPSGKVERFVDAQGNVVGLALVSLGDPNPEATTIRNRTRYHNDGHVEHAKCPLRHGIRFLSKAIEADFVELPSELALPCDADPVIMTRDRRRLMAGKACPHIEWLIEFRREREREQNERRNRNRVEQERAAQVRRELELRTLEKMNQEMDVTSEVTQPRRGRKRAVEEPIE